MLSAHVKDDCTTKEAGCTPKHGNYSGFVHTKDDCALEEAIIVFETVFPDMEQLSEEKQSAVETKTFQWWWTVQ